jgi:tetratricopeptide (TPR) repeat protein
MRIFCTRHFFIGALVMFIGHGACLFAQDTCAQLLPDDIKAMSDTLKKATIEDYYFKARHTGDLKEQATCWDQILAIDPRDVKADENLLKKVLNDLEEAVKTNPGDKELSDIRQRVQAKLDQRKVAQQVRDAIKAGHDAYFAEDSVQLTPALRALDDALKIEPTNPELNNWKQKIESRLRTKKFMWWLIVIGVVTAIVALIAVGLYLLLRKRQGMLEFAEGDRTGEIFRLDKPAIKIGALTEGNDLVVADPRGKISRYHCEIVREGRRYFIKDGSTNGTWVNEEYLESGRPKVLRKGDRLTLAGEVTFIFRLK